MKFSPGRALEAFASQLGVMAPLLLAAAVATTYAAGTAVTAAANAWSTKSRARAEAGASVALTKAPITDEVALRSADRVARLVPSVRVTVVGKVIVVSVADPQAFADFMYALTALQSSAADVVWEAESICLSACDGGVAARAVVSGYRQSISQAQGAPGGR